MANIVLAHFNALNLYNTPFWDQDNFGNRKIKK